MYSRRAFLAGAAGAALSGAGFASAKEHYTPPPLGARVEPVSDPREVLLDLNAAERPMALPAFGGREMPLWTFGDHFPPVVRMRLGDHLRARLHNNLPGQAEHTSVHWHGLRIPQEQDGVPYISQPPVYPGESWNYSFSPPDAGTFFFHTHCNTVEQLGRGLAGLVIVEGDTVEPYDADEVVVLKDWRIGDDGDFLPFYTPDGAKRRGTFGTVRSCNGATNPVIPVPASGDVRLRIVNIDSTRVMMLGISGAEAFVIAVDGIACPPFPLKTWMTGPAMRFDVLIRTPKPGDVAVLNDYFAPKPVPLATFQSQGPARHSGAFKPRALRAGRIAEPDLKNAEKRRFAFSVAAAEEVIPGDIDSALRRALLDDLCRSFEPNWSINKTVWPSRDHSEVPPPITVLERGKSYVFELKNDTSAHHPIHIHGHTLKVLKSNKRKHLPAHYADTILLSPKERVTAAFVADNPGDWMFHCHLIEHQESGMMSYIRVV